MHYDLETAPTRSYIWKMWKETVGLNQIIEPGRVICWAAKWHGQPGIASRDEYYFSHEVMVRELHSMMEQADVIVAYNGNKFDRPVMQAEFLKYGLAPPPPAKQIDLYLVVRKQFKLLSNRLAYVAQFLGLDPKLDTGGFDLWSRCLDGEGAAWDEMIDYNGRDVELLEEVYNKLLPWIPSHPNIALYDHQKARVCPVCGSNHVQSRGTTKTMTMVYRRFQCMDCKSWSRERLADKEIQPRPQLVRDATS